MILRLLWIQYKRRFGANMEAETRVAKFQKLREDISKMDKTPNSNFPFQEQHNEDLKDVPMSGEDLQKAHIKRNTLSISLNQIIDAYDEYTTMTEKKTLTELEKERRKTAHKALLKKVLIISPIVVLVIALVVLLIVSWR